jgi:hypothetical protein
MAVLPLRVYRANKAGDARRLQESLIHILPLLHPVSRCATDVPLAARSKKRDVGEGFRLYQGSTTCWLWHQATTESQLATLRLIGAPFRPDHPDRRLSLAEAFVEESLKNRIIEDAALPWPQAV